MKIADLFVDLHLDTSSFDRQLKTTLARAASKNVNVKVDADTRKASREIQSLDDNVRKATTGLNTFQGRISLIVSSIAALGPAAAPLGAVVVPAIAGLTGVAVGAAGAVTTIGLAFHGVGDALKAVNKAALEPTIANAEAMQQALAELSPAARDFVHELAALGPVADGLQKSAAEGLFPGLTESLGILTTKAPAAEAVLRSFGESLGGIAVMVATDLTSDRFSGFFDYLGNTAPRLLEGFSRALMDVVHGFTELLQATSGSQQSFVGWLQSAARAFDSWASGLKSSQDFQDFLSYVARNGPAVAALASSIGRAAVTILREWAPLGEAMIPLLTKLVDAFSAVIEIPFVPEFIAGAGALRLMASAMGLIVNLLPELTGGLAAISALGAGGAGGTKGLAGLASLAKRAAGPAGLGLLITNMGDLTQETKTSDKALSVFGETAGGALLGFRVGGPIGAGIGAVIALAHGLDRATAKAADSAVLASQNYSVFAKTLSATGTVTKDTIELTKENLSSVTSYLADYTSSYGIGQKTVMDAVRGDQVARDEIKAVILNARAQAASWRAEASAMLTANEGTLVGDNLDLYNSLNKDAGAYEKLDGVLSGILSTSAGVATATANLAAENYVNADSAEEAAGAFAEYKTNMALVQAQALSTFGGLTALGQALNAVKDIVKGGGINFRTEDGQKNRQVIQGIADAWNGLSEKAQKVPGRYAEVRQAFLDAAAAAHVPLDVATQLADTLLTMPDANAKVKIETEQAQNAIDAVVTALAKVVNKTVTLTEIHQIVTVGSVEENRPPGAIPRAAGGFVSGPGSATSDSIPARLSDGEFVMKNAAVRKYGVGFMSTVNALRLAGGGLVQRFAGGGQVQGFAAGGQAKGKGAKAAAANKAQYMFDQLLEELLADTDSGDPKSYDDAIRFLEKKLAKSKKWSDKYVELRNQLDDIVEQKKEAKQHLAQNKASYQFDKELNKLLDAGAEGNIASFDQAIAMLQKKLAKTKKWSDEYVALRQQIDDIVEQKREAQEAIREALADFSLMLTGDFFNEGIASQIKPGADFRNILKGVVDQAKALQKMGAISLAQYQALVAQAQSYTLALEGIQKQLDDNAKAQEAANEKLEEAKKVLADVQQRWDALKDSAKSAILTLQTFGDSAATTALADAQKLYDDAVAKYGEGSSRARAAKRKLDAAQITPSSIIKKLQGNLAKVRAFASNIRKLLGMGLGQAAIKEILAMGPIDGAVYAEALAKALPSDIAAINAAQEEIAAIGEELGINTANTFEGANLAAAQQGVAIAQGILDGLKSQQAALEAQMVSLGEAMAAAFKRALGIASPSKVFAEMGANTMKGLQIGIKRETGSVIDALPRLDNHLVRTGPFIPEGDRGGQSARLDRLISILENRGGQHSGPFIGQAIIRETVDLERYERQRAFRERTMRI